MIVRSAVAKWAGEGLRRIVASWEATKATSGRVTMAAKFIEPTRCW